jgi:hypothetical protein
MINAAPGFTNTTNIMTPCSSLILELFGAEIGEHARSAIGMAQYPSIYRLWFPRKWRSGE